MKTEEELFECNNSEGNLIKLSLDERVRIEFADFLDLLLTTEQDNFWFREKIKRLVELIRRENGRIDFDKIAI